MKLSIIAFIIVLVGCSAHMEAPAKDRQMVIEIQHKHSKDIAYKKVLLDLTKRFNYLNKVLTFKDEDLGILQLNYINDYLLYGSTINYRTNLKIEIKDNLVTMKFSDPRSTSHNVSIKVHAVEQVHTSWQSLANKIKTALE